MKVIDSVQVPSLKYHLISKSYNDLTNTVVKLNPTTINELLVQQSEHKNLLHKVWTVIYTSKLFESLNFSFHRQLEGIEERFHFFGIY